MNSLAGLVLFALLCADALGDNYTKAFYEAAQFAPILTYECYRTNVTLEPEDTVNFTILWDGTEPDNDKAVATTWYAPNGTVDQYTTGTFDYEYDEENSQIKITSSDVEEEFEILIEPYNDLGFYLKITIKSQNDRLVYKLYDIDPTCGNAAAQLRTVDPYRVKGFVFSRDVPRPTDLCSKELLCAP